MVSKIKLSLNLGFLLIASVIASDLRRILPLNLKIREGEDLQLRLTKALYETISCYVKTPALTSYNLLSEEPDSEGRIIYWTENGECGMVARNVTKTDGGRWRLTAKNSTHTLVDNSFVEILDKMGPQERHFSIESGLEYTLMLEESSRYCSIHQPHTEETLLVRGECKVELNQPTAAVDGNWMATAGVVGQLEEIPINVELNVFRDKLTTGYTRNNDTNTISAHCNLRDSDAGLEFCRFAKPDSALTGFQLSDGLRHGRYGYYGAGLENGECGITIASPTTEDYGQWLCSVGIKDEEPFGSYVWINDYSSQTAAIRAQVLPANTTTTAVDEVLKLRCQVSLPIKYCWFLAPDGEIFTPRQSEAEEEALYKYIGDGFGKGHCGLEMKTAEAKHEGQWTCHMGPISSGFELTSKINVTISETPLAARDRHITVGDGGTLTLECRIVPQPIAIDYCRFLMPDGTGIHIGDEVTENNPLILDNSHYWYSGSGLKFGNCGLRVGTISSKHFGNWTCAARLESSGNNLEVFDTIIVDQEQQTSSTVNNDNLTAAATTGIVSGVLILVGILAAGSVYVVKRIRARGFQDNISGVDTISISAGSQSSGSTNSGISLQELTSRRENEPY